MPSIDSWWDGLVRDRAQAVLELVLSAIADDYESLEIILDSINKWNVDPDIKRLSAMSAIPVSPTDVINALRELTREGYAQSYIFTSYEHRALPVEFSTDSVDELWFYVTPKGLRAVKQLNQDAVSDS